MRIYADINRFPVLGPFPEPESVIVQVAPTPSVGSPPVPVNGKFYVEIPEGVNPPPIGFSSRLSGPTPANVVPAIFQNLLDRFPSYSSVQYNALLSSADAGLLDSTASLPAALGGFATRAQISFAPNATAVLAQNGTTVTPRPGVLITDTITLPVPKSEFLVYWKIHEYAVSPDVMDYDGPSSGANTPATKGLVEIDQSPADFQVYLSASDGAGYTLVSRLRPCAVCDPGDKIRLAFFNTSTVAKRYLASYAILY